MLPYHLNLAPVDGASVTKIKLHRTRTYRVIATAGRADLVGARVRPVLTQEVQEFELKDKKVSGLACLLLSGPNRGSTVDMPPCRLKMVSTRKCYCKKYNFPHVPGLGKCEASKHEQQAPVTLDLDGLFTTKGGST